MKHVNSPNTPAHDEVKRFYDTQYYGSFLEGYTLPWHVKKIARRLGDLRGSRVLDVACGSGEWLFELASLGASVSGVDISSRAIEAAAARLPQADLKTGVAEALPFDNAQFDLVTCLGSLEHFLDQPGAIREMRRVAKPNAQFLILVPNADFLTRRIGLYSGTNQVAIRETVRPIKEWQGLFDDAGLLVERTWRDLHPVSLSWVAQGAVWKWPVRAAQALALGVWPTKWQYQVYFLCRENRDCEYR